MKRKILSSVFAAAVLTAAALPAMADDWLAQQLQETDGYDYAKQTYVPAPDRGAAGRPGQPPADNAWFEAQRQETDGYDYAKQSYVPAPERGAAGRAGHDQENDTWLQHQLERTDGSGE